MDDNDTRIVTAHVDLAEMACRLMEAILGRSRPKGASGAEFMNTIRALNKNVHDDYMRAAKVAADYMAKSLQAGLDEEGEHRRLN